MNTFYSVHLTSSSLCDSYPSHSLFEVKWIVHLFTQHHLQKRKSSNKYNTVVIIIIIFSAYYLYSPALYSAASQPNRIRGEEDAILAPFVRKVIVVKKGGDRRLVLDWYSTLTSLGKHVICIISWYFQSGTVQFYYKTIINY